MNPDVVWSTREKLAIASYVFHSGDQHWTGTVSRTLKPLGEPNRPADWFSPKNCAQQYTALLEAAENTRRKRNERSDSSDSSSSSSLQSQAMPMSETIVRKITQERVEELRKHIRNERVKYKKITQTIEQIESGELDDKLDDLLKEVEKKSPKVSSQQPKVTDSKGDVDTHSSSDCSEKKPQETKVTETMEVEENVAVEVPCKDSNNKNEDDHLPLQKKQTAQKDDDISVSQKEQELSTDKEEEEEFPEASSQEVEDIIREKATLTLSTPQSSNSPSPDPIEKGEMAPSSITSSDQTLPTPTPVIESDSCDEEEDAAEICKDAPEAVVETNDSNNVMETDDVIDLNPVHLPDSTILEHVEDSQTPIKVSTEEGKEESTSTSTHDDELTTPQESTKMAEHVGDEKPPVQDVQVVDVASTPTSADATDISQQTDLDEKEAASPQNSSLSHPADDTELPHAPEGGSSEVISSTMTSDTGNTGRDGFENESFPQEDDASHQSASNAGDDRLEGESFADYSMSTSSTPAYTDSFPSSPTLSTTSDVDPEATAQSRAWKKAIIILWKQVASHRYASIFLQPVTDDIAPNYSTIVYRPMDLATLKKNVENGLVRTTSEFQRDLMLMFQNALMYNNCEHDVYKMTQEMQKDVMDQVAQFLATQLMMETSKQATPKGLRRSTLRKSVISEKVSETRSKRSTGT